MTPSTIVATSAPNCLDVGEGDLGVLDRVVQQRGGERGLVEADVGDDAGDLQRVVDVALAAAAQLVPVRLVGGREGLRDHRRAGLRLALPVRREDGRELVVGDVLWRRQGRTRSTVPTDQYTARLSTSRSPEPRPPVQRPDLDQEAEADDDPAELLDQPARGRRGATGGEHVVDDEDPLAGMDRVAVHLQLVGAVLEAVLLAHDRPRQLARLAHGHEPGPDLERDGRGEDEPARLHPEHPIDGTCPEAVDELGDRPVEGLRVAEQRRDVAEGDPGLRVVGDVADQPPDPGGIGRAHLSHHGPRRS